MYDAFDGRCPACGYGFSLADLSRMAVGDGWQRYIKARMPDGSVEVVAFGEFNPKTMEALPLSGPNAADLMEQRERENSGR